MKKAGRCDEGGQQILSSRACRPRSCSSLLVACVRSQHDNTGEFVCACVCCRFPHDTVLARYVFLGVCLKPETCVVPVRLCTLRVEAR